VRSLGSDNERWYALNINPEPWAVGPLDLIRRKGKIAPTMGRNQQLAAYQQAIKDELAHKYAEVGAAPFPPPYTLDFYFWRNTERANYADATNLQKATEDALQGILIKNDRDVICVRSSIQSQGSESIGAVVFGVQWNVGRFGLQMPMTGPPDEILSEVASFHLITHVSDNSWPPR
jgi:Holliday junction resolvase RusA-like endonuclease